MPETEFFMLKIRTGAQSSTSFTLSEIADRIGLHPELIDRFVRIGLIDCTEDSESGELVFDSEVIPLIRRILRLRNDLGVNYAGIGVILELMTRIEALESRIRELEKGIQTSAFFDYT